MAGVLVDTNLLVYCYDRREPAKQQQCIALLEALWRSGQGRLAVQCLAEFVVTTTRPRHSLLTLDEAAARVEHYLRSWTVFDLSPTVIREALRGARRFRMNYWDAQIWAAARVHGLEAVFSEDFADGSEIEGVQFVNPLADHFDLAAWV